jgi:hypothetical protein
MFVDIAQSGSDRTTRYIERISHCVIRARQNVLSVNDLSEIRQKLSPYTADVEDGPWTRNRYKTS